MAVGISLFVVTLAGTAFAAPKKVSKDTGSARDILWQDPVDLSSRNLILGVGGADHQPRKPFRFVKEDLRGSNPKYTIVDGDGIKWKLKLGEEAQPETAASRLVWAAGYFTDDEYFVSDLKVDDVPAGLRRGGDLVEPDGLMHNARLKREKKGEEKEGGWKWKHNPFTGTREFNGLRVLMALINNWDLKDENNAVREQDGNRIYLVSDLGSSFGTTGLSTSRAAGKGNLENYTDSKFITSMTETTVSFGTPSRPALINAFGAPAFVHRLDIEWIGRDIPIADARWLGSILSKLSHQQIESAFAAGGYGPKQIAGFTAVVEARIAALQRL